jgi:hypothetical protein
VIWIRNESRTPSFHWGESALYRSFLEQIGFSHLGEDVGNLLLVEVKTALEDVVGLGDELHVSVLDTVVDHLDVVARTGLADPVAARLASGLSSGLLEDLLDVGPGGVGTTGHERGSVPGTLLTTRDTRADEEETLLLELVASADRVGVVRVTAVNDDVPLLEVGLELGDEVVDGLSGLDEEDDTPWALEVLAELLDGVGADDVGACEIRWGRLAAVGRISPLASFARKLSTLEVVLRLSAVRASGRVGSHAPVVGADLEPLVVHVEDQVLALLYVRDS